MKKKKCGHDNVADFEKLRYSVLHPVDFHTIKIGEKPTDLHLPDEKDDSCIIVTYLVSTSHQDIVIAAQAEVIT